MLDAIRIAAKSNDRRYTVVVQIDDSNHGKYYVDLCSLLYLTHSLSSNDGNKEAIVQHGGVPAITAILRPGYQAAIGVLQKLASLESNRDIILNHVTAIDKDAVQGTYN